MEISQIVLPLHILALLFGLWNIYHADHMGLAWVLGKKEKLDASLVKKYHTWTWASLIALIATGATLFYPMREFLLSRPQFFLKMGFVGALLLNGIAITFFQKRAIEHSFRELSFSQKVPLFISAGISSVGWVGAIICAFFLVPEY
ncbi:MAG: hypothetical protein QG653_378 [Patescibacteria group bacterium]|nr:hypothetical protein [Patescibacteria group bacterium]